MARSSDYEQDDDLTPDSRIYSDDDVEASSEDGDWEDEPSSKRVKQDKRLHSPVDEDDFVAIANRNQELEQRISAAEWRDFVRQKESLANKFKEAESIERTAEEYLAKAIAEANGDDAAVALRARDKALEEKMSIREQYAQFEQWEKQALSNPGKNKTDPVVNHYAKKWISKNAWYDINGKDEDSRVALQIDGQLVRDGYVPKSENYWKELDRRVKKALPHLFEGQAKARTNTKKEIYISKERKEALIAAGVWDDPQLRQKYVKQYQKWDKENRA